VRGYDTPGGRTGRAVARFFGRHPEEQLEEDLSRLRRLAERSRRPGGGALGHERVPSALRVERGERDDARARRGEAPRARHALTPRELQLERQREWETRRDAEERRRAGWY